MTEKKEQILNAALELFAKEGFKSISTSRIAKHAGVSEGLIFRHFENKEGLLEEIIQQGEEATRDLLADIVLEHDPQELLRKYIGLVEKLSLDKKKIDLWKLRYKIKWELERYEEQKMIVLEEALINAFIRLRYNYPEQEANLLLSLMDGITTRFMLQKSFDLEGTLQFLKQKYKL